MRVHPLLVAVAALACGAPDPVRLRVVATHDFHGALTPSEYAWSDGRAVGGIGTLKALMDSAQAECACPTLRLDGGDQMQGTLESNLTFGASVVEGFNLAGLDAAAIGNHELDWGVDTLRARIAEADYPWLAANVFERASGERPDWAAPWAMVEEAGVRVGVVGYITSTTGSIVMPEVVRPYEFRSGADPIRDALDAVARLRPDFTIIVSHAGGSCDGTACDGEMVALARALDSAEVDLIVSGHTHRPGYGFVNGIPIIRAGSSGRGISVVDLRRDGGGTRLLGTRVDTAFVDRVTPDATLLAAMTPYRLLADSLARRPVAHLREPLLQFRGEYPLGRLVVDAVRLAGEADVGLSNRGGVRASLPEGPVGYGDLFRVKPFGNQVVRLPVSGSELRRVVERALGPPDFLSGVIVEFDATRPAGERIVTLRLSDGRAVEDDGRYTLATSNFLSGGSGGYDFLAAIPAETQGMTILDAFILHLQGLPQPVVAPADARLVAVPSAR